MLSATARHHGNRLWQSSGRTKPCDCCLSGCPVNVYQSNATVGAIHDTYIEISFCGTPPRRDMLWVRRLFTLPAKALWMFTPVVLRAGMPCLSHRHPFFESMLTGARST